MRGCCSVVLEDFLLCRTRSFESIRTWNVERQCGQKIVFLSHQAQIILAWFSGLSRFHRWIMALARFSDQLNFVLLFRQESSQSNVIVIAQYWNITTNRNLSLSFKVSFIFLLVEHFVFMFNVSASSLVVRWTIFLSRGHHNRKTSIENSEF